MLAPKRVKFRKQQKGHRRGMAIRGSTLSFGDFGIKALGDGYATEGVDNKTGKSKLRVSPSPAM